MNTFVLKLQKKWTEAKSIWCPQVYNIYGNITTGRSMGQSFLREAKRLYIHPYVCHRVWLHRISYKKKPFNLWNDGDLYSTSADESIQISLIYCQFLQYWANFIPADSSCGSLLRPRVYLPCKKKAEQKTGGNISTIFWWMNLWEFI